MPNLFASKTLTASTQCDLESASDVGTASQALRRLNRVHVDAVALLPALRSCKQMAQ